MKFLGFLIPLFVSFFAHGYAEMIRHGYNNCTTCHFSPQGGGLMTQYGRSLSKEILSTWSYDREEEWFHGALPEGSEEKIENWLQVGADVRAIQTHLENNATRDQKFFLMQATLHTALTYKNKLAFIMDIGRLDKPTSDKLYYFYATSYYLLYQPIDGLFAKVGRFAPNFGLNVPDHNLLIKAGLGFTPNTERDGVNVSWVSKTWSAAGEALQSPDSISGVTKDRIYTAQLQRTLGETYKVGGSVWRSEQGSNKRNMEGIFATLGFTHDIYALLELDQRQDITPTSSQRGVYHFQRWAYEFHQGIHGFAQYQFMQSNLNDGSTRQDWIAPGFIFYPRPHFDVTGVWNRVKTASTGNWSDQAYAVVHYYF